MADQEFLASFAVDIDEAGVARLQTILTENKELAEHKGMVLLCSRARRN